MSDTEGMTGQCRRGRKLPLIHVKQSVESKVEQGGGSGKETALIHQE